MKDIKAKILIVEDEPIIADDLAAYMVDFGYEALPTASSAEEALRIMKQETPDLVLMDVGLEGEIDGIQLAGIIQDKYDLPFIFLTAFYDDRTIDRIKTTRPNGYLVKPIDEHSLRTSIEVALYNFRHRQTSAEESDRQEKIDFSNDEHFFIKVKQGLMKILLKDVLFFEAYDNYSYVYVNENKYIISMPLKSIENKLPLKNFSRIHRSYIVRIDKIQGLEDEHVIVGGKSIPIGKTYRSDIMKYINLL